MKWDQARALAAAGEATGSHTVTHADLTLLEVVSLCAELAVSRTTLEARPSKSALGLHHPSGRNDLAVRDTLRRVGHRTAVTEQTGLTWPVDDLLELPRVRVYGGVTLDRFAELVEGVARATPARDHAS